MDSEDSIGEENSILRENCNSLVQQVTRLKQSLSTMRLKYHAERASNASSSANSSPISNRSKNETSENKSEIKENLVLYKKIEYLQKHMKRRIFEINNHRRRLNGDLKNSKEENKNLKLMFNRKVNAFNTELEMQKKKNENLQVEKNRIEKVNNSEIEEYKEELKKHLHVIESLRRESKEILEEKNQYRSRLKILQERFTKNISENRNLRDSEKGFEELKAKYKKMQKVATLYNKKSQSFHQMEEDNQKSLRHIKILTDQLNLSNKKLRISLQRNEKLERELKNIRDNSDKSLNNIKKREKGVLRKIKNYKTLKVSYLELQRKNQNLLKALQAMRSKSLPSKLNSSLSKKGEELMDLKEKIRSFDVNKNQSGDKNSQLKEFISLKEKKKTERIITLLRKKVKKLEEMNRKMHIDNIVFKNLPKEFSEEDNSLSTNEGLRKTVFQTREVLRENEERLLELTKVVKEKENLDKKTKELRRIIIKKEIEIESLKNKLLKENEIH